MKAEKFRKTELHIIFYMALFCCFISSVIVRRNECKFHMVSYSGNG